MAAFIRWSVFIAAFWIALGLILSNRQTNESNLDRIFKGEVPQTLHPVSTTFSELVQNLKRGEGHAIISLGLIILFLLPFLRVMAATLLFYRQKDWIFFTFSFLVGLILVLGPLFY